MHQSINQLINYTYRRPGANCHTMIAICTQVHVAPPDRGLCWLRPLDYRKQEDGGPDYQKHFHSTIGVETRCLVRRTRHPLRVAVGVSGSPLSFLVLVHSIGMLIWCKFSAAVCQLMQHRPPGTTLPTQVLQVLRAKGHTHTGPSSPDEHTSHSYEWNHPVCASQRATLKTTPAWGIAHPPLLGD